MTNGFKFPWSQPVVRKKKMNNMSRLRDHGGALRKAPWFQWKQHKKRPKPLRLKIYQSTKRKIVIQKQLTSMDASDERFHIANFLNKRCNIQDVPRTVRARQRLSLQHGLTCPRLQRTPHALQEASLLSAHSRDSTPYNNADIQGG